jgi:succinoglycan biosynthesis protein ExoA
LTRRATTGGDRGAPAPLVTIVVAARNEEGHIQACLEALLAQEYPRDRLEILVLDGRSTDLTREKAAGFADADDRVIVLDNPGRIAATAFNLGIRAAKGEYVGVMSAHAVPAADYVARAVRALQETGAWAVGGKIDRQWQTPFQRAVALATSSPFGVGNAAHNYASEAQVAETVFPGMWPREVFERVGWFDASLVRNQDDEFSYRIREAGGIIWYDPMIRVAYEPRATPRSLFSQYRQYGFWRVRVVEMHPRALRLRQLVPAAWLIAVAVSGLGVLFHNRLRILAVPSVGGYLAVMSAAAIRVGGLRHDGGLLIAAFLTMHAAYGFGMLQGLMAAGLRRLARSGREPNRGRRRPLPTAGSSLFE